MITQVNKWLATRPVVRMVVTAALAGAVARGILSPDVGACLDLLLGAPELAGSL